MCCSSCFWSCCSSQHCNKAESVSSSSTHNNKIILPGESLQQISVCTMAETAVNIVIDKLIPLIAGEAKLLKGIHTEVRSIKDELQSIAAFLKEADVREARGETNDQIRVWVKEVIEVAYRMEDAMDEYLHHVAQQRHRNRMRFLSFLCKIGRFIVKLKTRHELASKIQEIKKTVREIKDRGNGYGLFNFAPQGSNSTSGMHNNNPIPSVFVDEADLVGIEAPKDTLLSWFEEEEDCRTIFSLVGMGGVGKTSLASKIYERQKGEFDCYAWITVSQTYSLKDLLRNLIQQFHRACKESVFAELDNMDEIQLIRELRDYVRQKRYVVAFDDVWDIEFWKGMDYALPDNKKGSRIVITTRTENVVPSPNSSPLNRVYRLQPLPFDEAWKLFCKKVFASREDELRYLPPLKELSEAMVDKCDGLPLAIVAIGGILSAKPKNVSEWQNFHNSLKSKLENDENLKSVMKVLSLSYHDLPYHLKPCLLYFGLFPEDHMIRGSRLIRQWNAEGFVKAVGENINYEDVAQEYLMELVRRNLVQVSEVDYSGKAREFRVHDLIRDFINSKIEEQRFGQIFTKHVPKSLSGRARRLSIIDNAAEISYENDNIPPVRSVFMFQVLEISNNFTISLFENFKLLYMLDFEDAPLTFLPEEIGNLFRLKYLSIRNTKVECLPKSIGKLQQLETLDMKQSLVRELPIEIRRLDKLRHLLAYRYDYSVELSFATTKGVTIEGGLGCMGTLQKLSDVEADGSNVMIKELRKFTQLRRLGITKVCRADGTELCGAIQNMKELRALRIRARNENEVIDLQSIVSPPPLLQRLNLFAKMEILPNWISKLGNVVTVHLQWSGLADNPLEALDDLPNLLDLAIYNDAYMGEQLHFQKGGFKKLKVLYLRDLKGLKKLIIDEGALSNLEELYIGSFSPHLKEVPSGIQHLSKLKLVNFINMPQEFNKSMAKAEAEAEAEEGPNYKLIRHIPNVYVVIKCGPGPYQYNLNRLN